MSAAQGHSFYFTFGAAHPYANRYHVIVAPTWEDARDKMFERFGREWAFQYDEDDWRKGDATQAEYYGLELLP